MNTIGNEEYLCYNTSCGLKFRDSDNGDSSCVYHSGKPYFHDGYKEWTCCKLKSADFTTFLSFKGCTVGKHNKNKPAPELNEEGDKVKNDDIVEEEIKPEIVPYVPPESNHVELIEISESASVANAPVVNNKMICKNCKQDEATLDLKSACDYHRGVQIFHDSLKFWSCCSHRKFTEFDDFQKQPPCAHADSHELIVKVDAKENWFQAPETITLAIYGLRGARIANGKSRAEILGGKTLKVKFFNNVGAQLFEHTWKLFDYIISDASKIILNQSNVQLILHKANPGMHWKSLIEEQIK